MIILHNPFDKQSRDFIDRYGRGNQIIEYPECVTYYPRISKFPAVVIIIPEHRIPEYEEYDLKLPQHPTIDLDFLYVERIDNEPIADIEDSDPNNQPPSDLPDENSPHDEVYISGRNVYEHIEIYNGPESIEEVELYIEEWEEYAKAYPIRNE